MKLLDRLLERGDQGRVQRTARIGELAQEFILQLYRPGQLLGIARKDSVLKSALDPLELSRELRAKSYFRQILAADLFEMTFHARSDERVANDQRQERRRSGGDKGEQFRSEGESHRAQFASTTAAPFKGVSPVT
ncbi:MAG TPA: hypothetical protein VII08_14050 [Myxococcales bacterium]